jgi:hypothetical protein
MVPLIYDTAVVIIFVSAPGYSERGPSASSTCATPTPGTRAPSDAANRTQNVKVGKTYFVGVISGYCYLQYITTIKTSVIHLVNVTHLP